MNIERRKPFVWQARWIAVGFLLAITMTTRIWSVGRTPLSSGQTPSTSYVVDTSVRSGATTQQIVTELQARLRKDPGAWQLYSQLGLMYLNRARETGDPMYYQKAEDVLEQALALAPDDYSATAGMATLALARHQFDLGLKWGERARQINPDRAYAYGIMTDALVELGRYDEAIAVLDKMVDMQPDLSAFTRISYIRELHGNFPGAIQAMQQAAAGAGPRGENSAWIHTQLGNLYFNTGSYQEAERTYNRALQIRPGYAYALAGLGQVRYAQGRPTEAVRLLKQAIQVAPIPQFVIMLGDVYQAQGDVENAERQYELVDVMQQLYVASGVIVDMEMALFNADRGRSPGQAVALAQAAYEQRPSVHGADVLAWALYRAGNSQEAWPYVRQSLRLNSADPLIRFHAGMIAHSLGYDVLAREYLGQALSTNPFFSIRYADVAARTLDELRTSTSANQSDEQLD